MTNVDDKEARLLNKALQILALNKPDALLLPSEVAVLFRVDPKTVSRWATVGKLKALKTAGGRYRFYASEVRAKYQEM